MKGKDFEKVLVERFQEYRKLGRASIGRYGVQAIHKSPTEIIPMASLPDFEGIAHGVSGQIIFDAKVCSQASFNLSPYREEAAKNNKKRQLNHMLERSKFGATCGFLIHWNERNLKTRSEPSVTHWFPVADNWFWEAFFKAEHARITRADCEELGVVVEWGTLTERAKKPRPNVLDALAAIMQMEASF